MAFTAADVKKLREMTNVGMMDCKKALTETDGAGQGLIKKIYEISQRPEFLGKIIFLEDYDFMLARRLVSGVDI